VHDHRGGPPQLVNEVLARARANAGVTEIPTRSPATEPPPASAGESPLERFERLAAEFHRETGIRAPGKDAPAAAGSDGIPEVERMDLWREWLEMRRKSAQQANQEGERHADGSGKAAPLPQPGAGAAQPAPADAEPRPNSPEDVGFLTPGQRGAAPAVPQHVPKVCSSCPAPIFWAQTLELDERGRWSRVRNESTGRFKSMPVDFQPTPDGNVVLFHRPGEGIVCRVLRKGEQPPPEAKLRTSHFATCPNARKHRRSR
jgi:hypothetical protein